MWDSNVLTGEVMFSWSKSLRHWVLLIGPIGQGCTMLEEHTSPSCPWSQPPNGMMVSIYTEALPPVYCQLLHHDVPIFCYLSLSFYNNTEYNALYFVCLLESYVMHEWSVMAEPLDVTRWQNMSDYNCLVHTWRPFPLQEPEPELCTGWPRPFRTLWALAAFHRHVLVRNASTFHLLLQGLHTPFPGASSQRNLRGSKEKSVLHTRIEGRRWAMDRFEISFLSWLWRWESTAQAGWR